jgi:cobalt-zinc-cadmium efflux system membrane fusion protein
MQDISSSPAQRAWPVEKQARAVLLLAVLAGCALLLIWGVARLLRGPAAAHPPPNNVGMASAVHLTDAQLATLVVDPVRSVSFRSERTADGKIALNADTTTQVFSAYSGRVTRVLVGIGEHVNAGTRLLAVEASELVQGESDLYNDASQLKLARINEERKHAAFESKGGSLQDWQQSQADLAAAQTALAAARNRLRILGKTEAEIQAMEAARSTDPIAYVLAPIAGTVTDRQVGPGQYVQAGNATPLYTIGNLASVWLVANVREEDAPLIEQGQQVEVRVLALPGRVFRATVTAIGATVDPVTHRVPVRATIANAEGKLKPEMFASFSIITSADSSAPAVPEEAVVREGQEARVWVLQGANELALRQIRTGRINNGMVEVLQGLRAGERVVTRGSLFIDRAAQPG